MIEVDVVLLSLDNCGRGGLMWLRDYVKRIAVGREKSRMTGWRVQFRSV